MRKAYIAVVIAKAEVIVQQTWLFVWVRKWTQAGIFTFGPSFEVRAYRAPTLDKEGASFHMRTSRP